MKYKTYKPNSNNKPAADKHKADIRARAEKFAAQMKPVQAKTDVLILLKEKYGLSTHAARTVYREAK